MQTVILILTCLLNLMLICESAHQELNSINDLKKLDFGQSVQKHSLLLLYWFASIISINEHNTVTVTFDPNIDFGSHPSRNYEHMLDTPALGYQYYTVGNLRLGTSVNLPGYLRNSPEREYNGRNRDRIIFSAERQSGGTWRIDRVYLTQHAPSLNTHDPQHTFHISTNLLRQIRQFSNGDPTSMRRLRNQFHCDVDDFQMRTLRQTWGENLACLGLLLFIVIHANYSRPFHTYSNTQKETSTSITIPSDEQILPSAHYTGETCGDVCQLLMRLFLLIALTGLVIIVYWIQK